MQQRLNDIRGRLRSRQESECVEGRKRGKCWREIKKAERVREPGSREAGGKGKEENYKVKWKVRTRGSYGLLMISPCY